MPWKCPACGLSIQHREEMPRPGVVYRCHICRLELTLDETSGKLDVPPADPPDRHNRHSPAKSASKRRKTS